MASFRRLKSTVRAALSAPDWRRRLAELEDLEPRKALGPLFSMLLDRDQDVRWRAAAGFGWLAGRMADQKMESARELMRMLMWRMNEESGNLGWGIPESMASAMAENETLAREFVSILASYALDEEGRDGNYLDHAELRRGVYWGLGALALERPSLVRPHAEVLRSGLGEQDPVSRAYAARGLGLVGDPPDLDRLRPLEQDPAPVDIFRNDVVEQATVADLAREAARTIQAREAKHA